MTLTQTHAQPELTAVASPGQLHNTPVRHPKTALIIGATGATGQCLVEFLIAHPEYGSVVAFTRRPIGRKHRKLVNHIVDFDEVDDWSHLLSGDELFSAIGTTMKQAGSKEEQYKVDFSYPFKVAEAARENGVPKIILVSSPNANPESRNFYLRTKGDLDHAVTELDFEHCALIKPSIIESERPDFRPGELVASMALRTLSTVLSPLRKYNPISAEELACAIVNIAQNDLPHGVSNFELDELFNHLEAHPVAESK